MLKNIEYLRRWTEEHPLVNKYSQMKRKVHKIIMPLLEFETWWEENYVEHAFCYYCDCELDLENKGKLDGFTIDRLDPDKGYTQGNIVPCCRQCNIIKGNWFTSKQMKEIAKKYLK